MDLLKANLSNIKFCLEMKEKRKLSWFKFLTSYLPSGIKQMNKGRLFVCGGVNRSFLFGDK